MESLDLLRSAVSEITRIVDGLDDADLGKQTPCAEWKVRDLLNHLVGGSTMFAVSAEEGSVPDDVMAAVMGGDNLGDDPKGAWRAASTRALSAFDDPGVMEKTLKLPFGEMPGAIALNIAAADVSTHLCDLSKATGAEVKDQAVLEGALALGKQVIQPAFRMPGVFDAEQPCPAGAPLVDQVLAFAGRKV